MNSNISDADFSDKIYIYHSSVEFAILLLFCILGIFGNVHASIVYYKKFNPSVHRVYVLILSVLDVMACVISLPTSVTHVRYHLSLGSIIGCQVFVCLDFVFNFSSCIILTLIALERYRKICRSTRQQMSFRTAKIVGISSIVVSLCGTVPIFMFLDKRQIYPQKSSIVYCLIVDLKQHGLNIVIYVGVASCICTVLFVVSLYCYAKIITGIIQRKETADNPKVRFLKKTKTKHRRRSSSLGNRKSVLFKHPVTTPIPSVRRKNSKIYRGYKRGIRVTAIFIIATCVSYVTNMAALFSLYVLVFNLPFGITINVLLFLFYVNNVINPIMYCIMDKKFRLRFKELYTCQKSNKNSGMISVSQ